jgi:general secretion pathway protein F
MLLLLVLLISGLTYAAIRPQGRAWMASLAWKTPKLGERLRIFQLTRFYRTTGMLLDGGIPAVQALDMACGLLPLHLRDRLQEAIQDIKEGKSISQSLQRADLTTPVALRLLRVGEKSGRMGEMMEASAKFHDEETTRFIEWFTRLFEPVLMLLIGLMIGVIVILLYMPIFELAGSLQ